MQHTSNLFWFRHLLPPRTSVFKRRRKELQLIFNERRFRALVENSNDAIAILSKDVELIYISPSITTVLGYTVGEIMQQDAISLVHPEDVAKVQQAMEICLANPGVPGKGLVVRVLHKNKSWQWIETTLTNMLHDPAIGGIVDNFRNVTEKKLAEEKIRIAKERYDIVIKATNEAVWEWDIQTNEVHWAEGFRSLFGYDPEKISRHVEIWDSYFHPEDAERVVNSLNAVVASESQFQWEAEYRFLKSNGQYAYVLDRGSLIRDTQGKPLRMIGAMQDITERKKNETSIINLNEELNRRAEELAASNSELEQFAYVTSHDLQEPLRMVTGFLELLKSKYENNLDETARQYIQFSAEGAERMKHLILDLLEYSRVNTSQEQHASANLGEIIKQVLDTYVCKIKLSNAIVKVSPMPLARVNRLQMTQLFQNLIGNALKYNQTAQPEIEIGFEEKCTHWQFFVKDNGIGIDPKFYERIFIIFQRLHTRNQFSGTGIGLAICKKIVEKHEGKIWVHSTPGQGSTFYFTIKK
jgi:PAS domain S-box-containing protein